MAITTTKGKPGEGMMHTLGPWIADDGDGGTWVVANAKTGEILAIVKGGEKEKDIARLIAAAPELLAELIKMTEYAERLGARPCSAWAVIAKATGKGE